MHTYWVLIRNSAGAPMRVELQSDNPYNAIQMAKALYGKQLISEGANFVR